MYYVNGWRGSREFRERSESPEGALLYMEAASEQAYERVTVTDKAGRIYTERDLRALADKSILPSA